MTLPARLWGTQSCLPSGEIARSEEKVSPRPVMVPTTLRDATLTMVISARLMWLM